MKSSFCSFVFVVCSFIFANTAKADGVTTGVNCNDVLAGGSTCTYGMPYSDEGYASGNSMASASLSDFAGTATVSMFATALSGVKWDGPTAIGTKASATADIHFTLSTPGPIRPGYLVLSFPRWGLGTYGYDSKINASVSVGSFQVDCGGLGLGFYSCVIPPFSQGINIQQGTQLLLPFVLGEPYVFDFSVSAAALDSDWEYPNGAFSGTINYQLTEVPEPRTSLLVAMATIAGWAMSRHRHGS